METAIRWGQNSTPAEQRFMIVDVAGHGFKYCRVTGTEGNSIQWQEISRKEKLPPFRAFDWNPDTNLIGIGLWSGEATIIGPDSTTPTLSFSVKTQRACNAIALNTQSLLAAGLDKIRNDFCLNVYDINQYITDRNSKGAAFGTQSTEPVRKLATSEGIVSLKFFPEQPNVLVAGVKGACLRIYDLRQNTGNPAIQLQTSCVHNIAIDTCDQNYIAAASTNKDSAVEIWDRRSTRRAQIGRSSAIANDEPLLEFKDVFGGTEKNPDGASIWSLRYSVAKRGVLGIMGSNNNFRVITMKKDPYKPEGNSDPHAEEIYVKHVDYVGKPRTREEILGAKKGSSPSKTSNGKSDQFAAFDWINLATSDFRQCAITLRANQDVGLYKVPVPPVLAISTKHQLVVTDNRPKSVHGGLLPHGLANIFPTQSGKISDSLADLDRKFKALTTDKVVTPAPEATDDDDGWNDDTEAPPHPPKQQKPQAVSSQLVPKGNIGDVLLLSEAWIRRVEEGYLYDAAKNKSIVANDRNLVSMWDWIGAAKDNAAEDSMVVDEVDFSYLGISNIWNCQLGGHEGRIRSDTAKPNISTAIKNLVDELELPAVELPKTAKTAHRRLCLHVLGFRPQPVETVKLMVAEGRNAEGALYAVMLDDYKVATIALKSGRKENQNRALSTILQQYADRYDGQKARAQIDEILADEKNIFSKAIIAYICGKGWAEVASSPDLPPRYRAAMTLKVHSDAGLTEYITKQTAVAIRDGDVGSILFTGLSDESIFLFSAYIEHTTDYQSAVLAMGHTSPRFLPFSRYPKVDQWREMYRLALNDQRMFIHRAQWSLQSTRLSKNHTGESTLKPKQKQITLACTNCSHPLHRDYVDPAASTAKASKVLRHDGTQCPKCGASLPRCVVCDMHMGNVDPHTPGGLWEEEKSKEKIDPFENFTDFCLSCKHMTHRGCASAWFGKHAECPAVGCKCLCNSIPGAPLRGTA